MHGITVIVDYELTAVHVEEHFARRAIELEDMEYLRVTVRSLPFLR